jgi:hypothetical protein
MRLLQLLQVWPPFGTKISIEPSPMDHPLRRVSTSDTHMHRTDSSSNDHLHRTSQTDKALRR